MTTRAPLYDRIEAAATKANAMRWFQEQDQFVFCIDLLEASAHERTADAQVAMLEERFEEILAA